MKFAVKLVQTLITCTSLSCNIKSKSKQVKLKSRWVKTNKTPLTFQRNIKCTHLTEDLFSYQGPSRSVGFCLFLRIFSFLFLHCYFRDFVFIIVVDTVSFSFDGYYSEFSFSDYFALCSFLCFSVY